MAQTSRKAKRHKNEKRTADKHLHKNSIKISLLEWTIKIALRCMLYCIEYVK